MIFKISKALWGNTLADVMHEANFDFKNGVLFGTAFVGIVSLFTACFTLIGKLTERACEQKIKNRRSNEPIEDE